MDAGLAEQVVLVVPPGKQVRVLQVQVRYEDNALRRVEMVVLGLLWRAALWITRKPGER